MFVADNIACKLYDMLVNIDFHSIDVLCHQYVKFNLLHLYGNLQVAFVIDKSPQIHRLGTLRFIYLIMF